MSNSYLHVSRAFSAVIAIFHVVEILHLCRCCPARSTLDRLLRRLNRKRYRYLPTLCYWAHMLYTLAWMRQLRTARDSYPTTRCPDSTVDLDADIGGKGVLLSLAVPAIIVHAASGAGHVHSRQTGIKELGIAQLGNLFYLIFNLGNALRRSGSAMSFMDLIVACLSLHLVISTTAAMLSQKEVLASRLTVYLCFALQTAGASIFCVALSRLETLPRQTECSVRLIWWGIIESGTPAPGIVWLHAASWFINTVHTTLLGLRFTNFYDKAKRATKLKVEASNPLEVVFDSIPKCIAGDHDFVFQRGTYPLMKSSTFTKWLDWLPFFVVDLASLYWLMDDFSLWDNVWSDWGQSSAVMLSLYGSARFLYIVIDQGPVSLKQLSILTRLSTWSIFRWDISLSRCQAIVACLVQLFQCPEWPVDHARCHRGKSIWQSLRGLTQRHTDYERRIRLQEGLRTNDPTLVKDNVDWDETHDKGGNILHVVVQDKKPEVIEALLRDDKDECHRALTETDSRGWTPLYVAAMKPIPGHEQYQERIVEDLIDAMRVDVELRKTINRTIRRGIRGNDVGLEVVRRIFEVGKFIPTDSIFDELEDDDQTVASHAVDVCWSLVLDRMRSELTLDFKTTSNLSSKLLDHVSKNQLSLSLGLLAIADTNSELPWGCVVWACVECGFDAGLRIVVDQGKFQTSKIDSVQERKLLRTTPLHVAVAQENEDMVRLLLENVDQGKWINVQDADGSTPIHLAVNREDQALTKRLLNYGPELDRQDDKGRTPLWQAVFLHNPILTRLLMELKPDLDLTDKDLWTPLHLAIHLRDPELVKLLLDHGADPDIPSKSGWSPLHWAVDSTSVDLIKLLLKYDADPALRKLSTETPFFRALITHDEWLVELLVDADKTSGTRIFENWLDFAIVSGCKAAAEVLKKHIAWRKQQR